MAQFLKRLFGARALPERLSYEESRAILEEHKRELQNELAARADAEPEILYYLAERDDPALRRAVAANPAAPAVTNLRLADDPDDDVRAELAAKIGRLLPDLSRTDVPRVCELTFEALDKLAKDQLPRVRGILAEEIGRLDCVPKHVIDMLARDAESTVAVPILEYSPLLSDADLVELVACARAQGALAAIARRRPVNEPVVDAIVATLDVAAVAQLLANPNARIREETLDGIIDHAQSIETLHAPLVMRTDLSVRALRRIAGFVGSALLDALSTRHTLDEETSALLGRRVRARLDADEDAATDVERAAQQQAQDAYEKGYLDDRFVDQAIKEGRRALVVEALAVLADVHKVLVGRILNSGNAKAITALAWHAGLSMRTAFQIQTQVARLPAADLLPARDGVAFPLSDKEMRWHLSYFGLSTPN